MKEKLSAAWALVRETVAEVIDDDVPSLSAAIAYYTIFSLPPLLVILAALAGVLFGAEAVREALFGQVGGLVGSGGAEAVRTMVENAGDVGESTWAKVVGVGALLVGASGAFGALQKALNRAWEVEAGAENGGLSMLIAKRLLSFGMVLTIAFFLLVSLALSTFLGLLSDGLASASPIGLPVLVWQLIDTAISVLVITGLFAVMFKTLPDAEVSWHDVGMGAAMTAVLFTMGKWALGFYLGTSDPGSVFGAAGSLVLILVWIYYSALIVLAGAEFTQVYAQRYGTSIRPDPPGGATPEAVHPHAQERAPNPY